MKNNFFEIGPETEEEKQINPSVESQKEIPSNENIKKEKNSKKSLYTILGASISIILLIVILLPIINSSDLGGKYYQDNWLTDPIPDREAILDIYVPDWESDIYTVKGYLEVMNDLKYFPDGSNSTTLSKNEYLQFGGKPLVFLGEYFDALLRGDNEAINKMYSENYFKSHDKFSEFPKQKLFDIKVLKYYYNDPAYDYTNCDDYYFIVSYKIYHNDGLFRKDIDEHSELPQLIKILIYDDGHGEIDQVINAPGYPMY